MEKANDAASAPSPPGALKPELRGATLLLSSLFNNIQPQTPDGQKSRHEDYRKQEAKTELRAPVLCPQTPHGDEKNADLPPPSLWAPHIKQLQHEKSSTEDTAASPRAEAKEGKTAELHLPLLAPDLEKPSSVLPCGSSPASSSSQTKSDQTEGKSRDVKDAASRAEDEDHSLEERRRFLRGLETNGAETIEVLGSTATGTTETSPGGNDGGCIQCSDNSLASTVSALREIPDTDSDSTTYSPDDPQQLLDLYFHLAKKIEDQKAESSPPSVTTLANASTDASASVTPIASSSWPRLSTSFAPTTPPLPYRSASRSCERRALAAEANPLQPPSVGDATEEASRGQDDACNSRGELLPGLLVGSRSSEGNAGSYFLRNSGGRGSTAGRGSGKLGQQEGEEPAEPQRVSRRLTDGGMQSVDHGQPISPEIANLPDHGSHHWNEPAACHPDNLFSRREGGSPDGRTQRVDDSARIVESGQRTGTWRSPSTSVSRSRDVREALHAERLSGGAASLNFQVLSKLLFGDDEERRRWEHAAKLRAPEFLPENGEGPSSSTREPGRQRMGAERSSTPEERKEELWQQEERVGRDGEESEGCLPELERAFACIREEGHEQNEGSCGRRFRAAKRQDAQRPAGGHYRLPTWQQQLLRRDGMREAEGVRATEVMLLQEQDTRRPAYKENAALYDSLLPACGRELSHGIDFAEDDEPGTHRENAEGKDSKKRWAVAAEGQRNWDEGKMNGRQDRRELVRSRAERKGAPRQGGTRKSGPVHPSEDDSSLEGDLAADVDEEQEVLKKIFLLGRARKQAGIHTGRALRIHGSASPRSAPESDGPGGTLMPLGATGPCVSSEAAFGQRDAESGFPCAARRRGAAKRRVDMQGDKEDDSWIPPGKKETRESKTRARSGQQDMGMRLSNKSLLGMPGDTPPCEQTMDPSAQRTERDRPSVSACKSATDHRHPAVEGFPICSNDELDPAGLDGEDPRSTGGGILVPAEDEPLSQQQVALLSHIYDVLSKSEEYFSFKSALYQLHIKRHLKSCVSGSSGSRHTQNNTRAIRLFPFMPAVPINGVEQRALLGVRKRLESCGGFALVQSVAGQQVVEEMDELLTSLINKVSSQGHSAPEKYGWHQRDHKGEFFSAGAVAFRCDVSKRNKKQIWKGEFQAPT